MAIGQTETTDLIQIDIDKDLMYNLQTHRLVPTNDLIFKGTGTNIETKITKEKAKVVLSNISNIVYGFLFNNSPIANHPIILALIAENDSDEQLTMARAFIAMANYAFKGGDELVSEIGIDFNTGIVIPLTDIRNRIVSEEVKSILANGNGMPNTGLWKRATLQYTVDDVTDLVFGTDY